MRKVFLTVMTIITIVSCGKHANREDVAETTNEMSDRVSNAVSQTVEGKVFKSNAMLEMKVADVLKNGQEIEQHAIENHGFVLNSELTNNTLDSKEVNISNDSVKKMTKIQRQNLIELKVPSNKLREHIIFALNKGVIIDHILINNEELTFQKYENDLKNDHNSSVKISKQIENKVNKAVINDGIDYATIAYSLSEEPHVVSSVLPQAKLDVYKEINLGYELKQAWLDGVYYFKLFLIIFCQCLPTILSILGLIFGIKYLLKRFKKK